MVIVRLPKGNLNSGNQNVLILSAQDNVAIASEPLEPGQVLPNGAVVKTHIAAGHKVATRGISFRGSVKKYGQVIGCATENIAAGSHVHSHNLEFVSDHRRSSEQAAPRVVVPKKLTSYFNGFRRADGRAGTRNYIGIIASVNCSATVCQMICDRANADILPRYSGIDGFVPITHGLGCGSASSGRGIAQLRRTISGYCRHPNFGGTLLIGLGCEVNQLSFYLEQDVISTHRALNIQNLGGTKKTIERAIVVLEDIAQQASRSRREPIPVSELKVGLQCGGSDGVSGITANPALGVAVDMLAHFGGTGILSETPEIYGAEHLLLHRAANPEVAEKLNQQLNWWKDYVRIHAASLDNNPSPGNKEGGLTTILEKSLGAIAKGGSSPLQAVYDYAEQIESAGLVFMDTPGYDPVSVTGQIAGGANVIVFTTGRGSCFGSRPVPSLKVASNSPLFEAMLDDMDLNAGKVLSCGDSIDQVGQEIFDAVISTASGKLTKSEQNGYGDLEFVPWNTGATL